MKDESTTDAYEVWHYTTKEGLEKILRSDTLLAGQASQMNDAAEITWGHERVRKLVSELGVHLNPQDRDEVLSWWGAPEDAATAAANLYSLSASTNGDNLTLWRGYGGPGSYAIRLEPSAPLFPIVDVARLQNRRNAEELLGLMLNPPFPHAVAKFPGGWVAVDYQASSARPHAEALCASVSSEALRQTGKEMAEGYRYDLSARIKHHSFSAEEEVRKTFRVSPIEAFRFSLPSPDSGSREFIKVGYTGNQEQSETVVVNGLELLGCIAKPQKLPILEVRLSPNGHGPGSQSAVEDLLTSAGHTDVHVSVSASPFKG